MRNTNPELCDDNSSMDGELVNYDIAYGNRPINSEVREGFMSSACGDKTYVADGKQAVNRTDDYYSAAGKQAVNRGGDDFFDATGGTEDAPEDNSMPDDFYDAGGKKRKKTRRKGFFGRLADNAKEKNRLKFGAKKTLAQAQLESARQSGKIAKTDAALARTLAKTSKPEQAKGWAGLSTGAKAGIVVGSLAVLGLAGYLLMRKK